MDVKTTVDFDKQDIVTVALAKIEAKIRKGVRDAKAQVATFDNKIKKLQDQLPKLCKEGVPKGMLTKSANLNKALKASKLGKNAAFEVADTLHSDENSYELRLVKLDRRGRPTNVLAIMTESILYTKIQNDILKEIAKLREGREQSLNTAVNEKARLSDMPAAERQMRAVCVEAELKKTKEGKALVDLIVEQYEDSMKLLEM